MTKRLYREMMVTLHRMRGNRYWKPRKTPTITFQDLFRDIDYSSAPSPEWVIVPDSVVETLPDDLKRRAKPLLDVEREIMSDPLRPPGYVPPRDLLERLASDPRIIG